MSNNLQRHLDWMADINYRDMLIGQYRQYHSDSQFDFDTYHEFSNINFNLNNGDFNNGQQASIPVEPNMMDDENEHDDPKIENLKAKEQESQSHENEKMMEKNKQKKDSDSEEKNQSNGNNNHVEKYGKIKKQYNHLKRGRRPKGQKNQLQAIVRGHWTKNLLQSVKKPHLDCIKRSFPGMVDKNLNLKKINKKDGIRMDDFVTFYKIPQLDGMWKDFFANKVLYRELMLSRASSQFRLIYCQFLHVFKKAFNEKRFDGITHIQKKSRRNYGQKRP